MPVLSPQDRKTVEDRFKRELREDISLTLFTVRSSGLLVLPGRECATCAQANELVEEVASLSPKLKLTTYDFYTQSAEAQAKGVDRIPCLLINKEGDSEPNLKFYGMPAGYEFVTLLEDIVSLSREVSPLRPLTRKALRQLDQDVHIQVFVTPGCPYCPQLARMSHAMAVENPRIRADVIEAQEFPYLASSYRVQAVPKTVINGVVEFVGAVPEQTLLQKVLMAVGREDLLEVAKVSGSGEAVAGPTTLIDRPS